MNFVQPYAPANVSGKGKAREEALEALFAEYATEAFTHAPSAKIEEVKEDASDLTHARDESEVGRVGTVNSSIDLAE